jgi:hypothetical protein
MQRPQRQWKTQLLLPNREITDDRQWNFGANLKFT